MSFLVAAGTPQTTVNVLIDSPPFPLWPDSLVRAV